MGLEENWNRNAFIKKKKKTQNQDSNSQRCKNNIKKPKTLEEKNIYDENHCQSNRDKQRGPPGKLRFISVVEAAKRGRIKKLGRKRGMENKRKNKISSVYRYRI